MSKKNAENNNLSSILLCSKIQCLTSNKARTMYQVINMLISQNAVVSDFIQNDDNGSHLLPGKLQKGYIIECLYLATKDLYLATKGLYLAA